MKISGLDERYSVKLEFCGHELPQYVIRFCGEFLASCGDAVRAEQIAIEHNKTRLRGF